MIRALPVRSMFALSPARLASKRATERSSHSRDRAVAWSSSGLLIELYASALFTASVIDVSHTFSGIREGSLEFSDASNIISSGNVSKPNTHTRTHTHTIMPSASSPAFSGVSMTTVFLFFAVAAAGVTEGTLTHIPITHNSAGSIGAWGPIDVWACGWGCTSPQTHAHGIQVMTGLKPNQWYLSGEDPIIPSGSSSAIVVATGTFGEMRMCSS
jgi:hypothetical protein